MRHFVSGKPAKTLDETNIDWAPTLYLRHTKCQQHLQGDQLGRFESARRRTENQKQQDEQKTMFLGIAEPVG